MNDRGRYLHLSRTPVMSAEANLVERGIGRVVLMLMRVDAHLVEQVVWMRVCARVSVGMCGGAGGLRCMCAVVCYVRSRQMFM